MTRQQSEVVQRELEAAQHRLSVAAGDQSLCAIGRSGRPFPAVKFHEGEVATLGKIRSRMRAGDAIEEALSAASRDLDRLERLAGQSPDWNAYLAGGTGAIERISDSIQVDSL